MGIFDEVKRLLWVKKAVAESAADKAAEKGRELGDEFADKASETWTKGKEFAEDLGEKIVTGTKEGIKEVKEVVNDLWDKKDDWTQKTPPPADKPVDETAAFTTGEKLGENAAKTWDKVKEEGKEILDKAVEKSDKVWEKTEAVSEDLWNKAKDAATKVGQKVEEGIDSMLEKAKALDKKIEEETDKVDANRDGWADTTVKDKLKEHESTLKGKDDFFERAARYGDGDYSMGKPVVTKPGDPKEEGLTPLPPLPKDDDFADDAILDEDDEK
jgi:polyhydroxyalkanoate synthesis regulator phasin